MTEILLRAGCVGIVPAAGRGERFGGAKMLAPIDGEPMLGRAVRTLLDAGVPHVTVVLAPDLDVSSVRILTHMRVATVINPEPARGMFSSIQTGVAAVDGEPILVLPGDMPFVNAATVVRLLDAFAEQPGAIAPQHDHRHGHPLALPAAARHAILQAAADSRLDEVLAQAGHHRRFIDVDDAGVVRDVDVIGDLR